MFSLGPQTALLVFLSCPGQGSFVPFQAPSGSMPLLSRVPPSNFPSRGCHQLVFIRCLHPMSAACAAIRSFAEDKFRLFRFRETRQLEEQSIPVTPIHPESPAPVTTCGPSFRERPTQSRLCQRQVPNPSWLTSLGPIGLGAGLVRLCFTR